MSKSYKYVLIENGIMKVCCTKRMNKTVKDIFAFFDYRDYLFEEDSSLYILVKDMSYFDEKPTILYLSPFEDDDVSFNGTIVFAKFNEEGFTSLTNKDITLIQQHLHKLSNGLFQMYYSLNASN